MDKEGKVSGRVRPTRDQAPAILHGQPDGVLFDMDGVITDTATAHAAAWKRMFDDYLRERADRIGADFKSFDDGREYRRYVDGKPRSDGVRSFLESRGIELPFGNEEDSPDLETVCGLGNRKNRYFENWLAQNRVRAYPGTLKLAGELRKAGIRTAVFSASRNAGAVLGNAGVQGLFDIQVDGDDLARLDFPGKPHPAMLLEAARRLGVAPGRAVVVEDAIAGIEAGVRGGFGLVIGVDRAGHEEDLKKAGAHVVVHDLAELRFAPTDGLAAKTLATLPCFRDLEDEIRSRLATELPVVFLDYDGTLTPIVQDHTRALLSEEMRAAVADLARRCAVVIVSGRDLERVRALVKLDSVFYAGSHGFEIAGPRGADERLEKGVEFLDELDRAERGLRSGLAGVAGHSVERKKFSIAVHFRRVAAEEIGSVRPIVERVLGEHPGLRLGHGKKVFEVRPDIEWNKGCAVLWILERLGRDHARVMPIYIGDDLTDEDAFQALAGRGVCVAVRYDEMRQTAADCAVDDTQDVRRVLAWLSANIAGPDAAR